MRIDTHLQPNCSESSWRVLGPKQDLEKLKKLFLARCNADEYTKWFPDGTLLLQTRDQETAGSILEEYNCPGHPLKFYCDEENQRDCQCGGHWVPEQKWADITNVDKLVKGLVKRRISK
jgi:hypothetical protein